LAERTFSVSLVTPEGAAFEGEVEMLVVPGADGEIGVLARHAPLIALLKAGSTRVYKDRSTEDVLEFATGPGFFKVEQDRALALVDDAVESRNIDDDRARKIERYLSQPFFVAEVFTGTPGQYVKLEDTILGFTEILDGKHDDLPEQAFYMVGTIDEAVERGKSMAGEEPDDAAQREAEEQADEDREPAGASA